MHRNNRKVRNDTDKYEEDLYETNKYLKKKIQMLQETHAQSINEMKQSHREQIMELKQQSASKHRQLELKAVKLSTNLKKLGKMYQTLQNEYNHRLKEHKHGLEDQNDFINSNCNTNSSGKENDITMIEYDMTECSARATQHGDGKGVSLQWNEGSANEFGIVERNIDANDVKRREEEDVVMEKRMDAITTPIKYVEVVRGKKRNELPGHECAQCQKFYALNKNLNDMNREKFCNCVSRHRAKHQIPATPNHFWDIDFATQQ